MAQAVKKYALIVAGGKGLRMNQPLPKQFLEINKLPVLMHTINAFNKIDGMHIILVLPKLHIAFWDELCKKHQFSVKHQIVEGGELRFNSVLNGLNCITEEDSLVAIHDGVRPLITAEIIHKNFSVAQELGNALTVVKPKDSIRQLQHGQNISVNRDDFYLVQTPQTFKVKLIKEAYNNAQHFNFTDDASVLENSGAAINIVEGSYANIKITTPEDLLVAEALLNN